MNSPNQGHSDKPRLPAGHPVVVPALRDHVLRPGRSLLDRPAFEPGPAQPKTEVSRKLLGAGRSAQVYLESSSGQAPTAVKAFQVRRGTSSIQNVVLGHPNPYFWCRAACDTAYFRRNILARLVPALLGEDLQVARASEVRRNSATGGFELATEWIDGRAPKLRGPFSITESETDILTLRRALKLFQGLAREAGFTGLLWQAGWGNPVAADNFLLSEKPGQKNLTVTWIDLESAYPPIFSPSPWAQLRTYLPRSLLCALQRGQPLFDDVDVKRLNRFLDRNRDQIADRLGSDAVHELMLAAARLAVAQQRWRSVSRLEGQLNYRETSGRFTRQQADYYRDHKLRFVGRLVGEISLSTVKFPVLAAVGAFRWLRSQQLWERAKTLALFYVSDATRQQVSDHYVTKRIEHWTVRNQLAAHEAAELKQEQKAPTARRYLGDLICQSVGMVPVGEALRGCAALLVALGRIDPAVGGLIVAFPGCFTRPLYSLVRFCVSKDRWAHAIAFPLSAAPLIGKMAYTVPLTLSGLRSGTPGKLGAFLFYDSLARIGQHLPIWGGRDTATEHFFNRTIGKILTAPGRLGRREPK